MKLSTPLLLSALASGASAQGGPYSQCGGTGWTGATTCQSGWTCIYSNPYYSQCLPSTSSSSTSSKASSSSQSGSSSSSTSSSTSSTKTSSASSTATPSSTPTVGPSRLTGKLPALGWNGWNAYGCAISADKVLAAANSFVSLGLQDAGYQYVNIDDCWAEQARDSTTNSIVPDPTKFPNGISGLAAQVHALGLKIGIYGDAGTATCSGFPGSLGYENVDAASFASWGIDYLKYDNCNVPSNWTDSGNPPGGDWYNSNSAIRYRQMTAALVAQSQPIQYNLCIWGNANVWQWGARVGHSWRMSGDSSATWSYITSIINTNVQYLDAVNFFAHNDMDMMEIGNGALTLAEQRTHFAAWAFLKSPILLGTDLSQLNSTQISIITNSELLAFHQDPNIGTPANPFTSSTSSGTTTPPEFYAGASSKGIHVFVINTAGSTATKTMKFVDVPGLNATSSQSFKVHDMWSSSDLGTFTTSYGVSVGAHDTVAVLVTPV
ncbi:glycoside hydrolase family 27 protein [Jaapia argillacea MUCL 33604]|uniref:Alpha-galactosidase n=1 Tax=Jaapia argillacea MUCL 33604 TaxID=933084 RepID=A0A067PRV1_9AGAM|nr:glycoside hydrolase family 27 protein [Jaapia argillacea MUCL 33604]